MGVIWRYIKVRNIIARFTTLVSTCTKTAMVFRTYLRANGSAGNALYHQKFQWYVHPFKFTTLFLKPCQNCDLCPNEGGAFKQTVTGEWVHLLCAIWIPETRVANEVFMEPITGVDRISKQRWKLVSYICLLSTLVIHPYPEM